MAIYLTIFWTVILTFLLVYAVASVGRKKALKERLDKDGFLVFIFMIPFLIMAILTNDPMTLFGIDIPVQLQWLGSLLITLFGSWKFYLKDLKEKVYSMDKELEGVKKTVELIKDHLLGKRK